MSKDNDELKQKKIDKVVEWLKEAFVEQCEDAVAIEVVLFKKHVYICVLKEGDEIEPTILSENDLVKWYTIAGNAALKNATEWTEEMVEAWPKSLHLRGDEEGEKLPEPPKDSNTSATVVIPNK